jgi:SPP1 gp7 family putative phage head morphogenesis protein
LLILAGLKRTIDVNTVARKWVEHKATELAAKSPASDSARSWLDVNFNLETNALEDALKEVYGSGWAFGNTDSEQQLGGSVADPWAGWNAGNEAAAALVDPPKGLQSLLDKSKVTIDGIKGTTLDQMGTQLAASLSQGLGAEQTANNLLNVIDDSARAMVIARTETARAICDSNVSNYRENGVEQMQWITADPCDVCAENDGEIVNIGDTFSTGDEYPPAHPNCVCDVSPIGSVTE